MVFLTPNVAESGRKSTSATCSIPGRGHPQVGLMLVKMKRLDGAGIAERRGNLRSLGRKILGETLLHTDYFQKISAIVGPDRQRTRFDTVNEVRAGGILNDFSDSPFAMRNGNLNRFDGRCAHCLID